jgi:hypothetical protein
MLFDAEDPPLELREPRLPTAPTKWPCVRPELELVEWPESSLATLPRRRGSA